MKGIFTILNYYFSPGRRAAQWPLATAPAAVGDRNLQMTEGKRNIIHQLLEEYDIQTAEDIQDALKDLLGGTIKEMMEAEMDDHLGYEKSERSDNDDYRNGYKRKRVNSSYGAMEIEVPQDRKSTYQPQVVKKREYSAKN